MNLKQKIWGWFDSTPSVEKLKINSYVLKGTEAIPAIMKMLQYNELVTKIGMLKSGITKEDVEESLVVQQKLLALNDELKSIRTGLIGEVSEGEINNLQKRMRELEHEATALQNHSLYLKAVVNKTVGLSKENIEAIEVLMYEMKQAREELLELIAIGLNLDINKLINLPSNDQELLILNIGQERRNGIDQSFFTQILNTYKNRNSQESDPGDFPTFTE